MPVRFGIFTLSLSGVVGGSIVAATGWLQVRQLDRHPLQLSDIVALYFYCFTFTALAVISLFGFIAASFPTQRLIRTHLILLLVFLVTSLGLGPYTLFRIFFPKPVMAIERCMNGGTDALTRQVCETGIAVIKGVAVVVYIVLWCLVIYACVITYSYLQELRGLFWYGKPQPTAKISNPAPLTMYNSAGAAGVNTGYAFSTVQPVRSGLEVLGSAKAV